MLWLEWRIIVALPREPLSSLCVHRQETQVTPGLATCQSTPDIRPLQNYVLMHYFLYMILRGK